MESDKLEIVVWKVDDETYPYPWRFKITRGKESWELFGIPNCFESRRSAMGKAVWVKKLIEDGTFWERYA